MTDSPATADRALAGRLPRLLWQDGRPGGLALLLFSLVFVCLSLTLIRPQYIENDDVTILDFAVRGFMVPYVGVLFTDFLHLVYSAVPTLPWYGLSLYALHVLALCLWLALLWRVFRPAWLAVAFTLVLLGYYLIFLFYLNYTSTSVMLCASCLSWACLDALERRPGLLRYALLGLVFALGMLARPQGATGTLAYMLPLTLVTAVSCLRGQPWAKETARLVLIAAVFFTPPLLNFAVDTVLRHYTATPEETQYDAFNAPRGKLHRMSGLKKERIMADKALLDSVHWARHDAADFFSWNFFDERLYSPQALQTVLQDAPPAPLTARWVRTIAIRRLPERVPLLFLLGASLCFFLPVLRRRPLEGVLGALACLWGAGLTIYMYLFFSYTYRVELPMETGLGLSGLLLGGFLAGRDLPHQGRAWKAWALAGLCMAAVGLYHILHREHASHRSAVGGRIQLEHEIKLLNTDYPGSIILVQPKAGLQLEKSSPLEVLALHFDPIQLGWSTFSPRFYQQIAPLGIDRGYQLVDALATHDNAYAVCGPNWCKGLLRRASDPSHVKLVFVRLIRGPLGLYRLQEVKK
jgi:hypothetical protein